MKPNNEQDDISSEVKIPLDQPSTELLPLPESKDAAVALRWRAFDILRKAGLNQAEASRALGLCRASGTKIERIRKKYDLTTSKFVKQAAKAHTKLLDAFLHPESTPIPIDLKGSDVNRAIDRVYERAEPVKKDSDTGDTKISFIQINLDGYRCDKRDVLPGREVTPPEEITDCQFTTIPEKPDALPEEETKPVRYFSCRNNPLLSSK